MSIIGKIAAHFERRMKELEHSTTRLNEVLLQADKDALAKLAALEKNTRPLSVPPLDLSRIPRVLPPTGDTLK